MTEWISCAKCLKGRKFMRVFTYVSHLTHSNKKKRFNTEPDSFFRNQKLYLRSFWYDEPLDKHFITHMVTATFKMDTHLNTRFGSRWKVVTNRNSDETKQWPNFRMKKKNAFQISYDILEWLLSLNRFRFSNNSLVVRKFLKIAIFRKSAPLKGCNSAHHFLLKEIFTPKKEHQTGEFNS